MSLKTSMSLKIPMSLRIPMRLRTPKTLSISMSVKTAMSLRIPMILRGSRESKYEWVLKDCFVFEKTYVFKHVFGSQKFWATTANDFQITVFACYSDLWEISGEIRTGGAAEGPPLSLDGQITVALFGFVSASGCRAERSL